MDLGKNKDIHRFPSVQDGKTVDFDSAAGLPTETDGQNTREYTLNNTHRFRSGGKLEPDLRHFPMSEDLIIDYNVLNIQIHVNRHFPMYAQ